MSERHLPAPKEIRDLFADLLGREVTYGAGTPLAPGLNTPASIAVYVDDANQVQALIVCDLALSMYAGAAIGLVPASTAQKWITTGLLHESLVENLYEVLNVAASLFNAPGAMHLRLYELHPAGGEINPALLMRALTLGQREDACIDIDGYGPGRLSVVLC